MVQIAKHVPENYRFIDVNGWYTERSNEPRKDASPPSESGSDDPTLPEPPSGPARPVTTPCHRPARVAVASSLDLSIALDLRRRQPRPVVEAILALSAHLPTNDRSLIHAIFEEGRTVTDLARCMGERPRFLRRRFRRIVARLIDPRFAFVASQMHAWPHLRRLAGTLHILHARTLRDTARRLALTEHAVRREISAIDALFSQHRFERDLLPIARPDTLAPEPEKD